MGTFFLALDLEREGNNNSNIGYRKKGERSFLQPLFLPLPFLPLSYTQRPPLIAILEACKNFHGKAAKYEKDGGFRLSVRFEGRRGQNHLHSSSSFLLSGLCSLRTTDKEEVRGSLRTCQGPIRGLFKERRRRSRRGKFSQKDLGLCTLLTSTHTRATSGQSGSPFPRNCLHIVCSKATLM